MRILGTSQDGSSFLHVAIRDKIVILDVSRGEIRSLHHTTSMSSSSPSSSSVPTENATGEGKEENEYVSVIAAVHCYDSILCAIYSDKSVHVFDIENGAILSTHVMPKRPVALTVARLNESQCTILIADKAAEVWALDLPYLQNSLRILGHTASIITDLRINHESSLLITADRDEKIRVSRFPQTVGIEAYCLGHTSVVTSIDFISIGSKQFLVSTGRDYKLILWDHSNGQVLHSCQLKDDNPFRVEPGYSLVEKGLNVHDDADGVDGDKTYDQSTVGCFPMRVIASPGAIGSFVALIFKDLPYIKVFCVKSSSQAFENGKEMSVRFAEPPCDLVFQGDGLLVAILPSPPYMQTLKIDFKEGSNIDATTGEGTIGVFGQFRKLCENIGKVGFEQKLDFSQDTEDENNKMRKHTLDDDRRFVKERLGSRSVRRSLKKKGKKARVEDGRNGDTSIPIPNK